MLKRLREIVNRKKGYIKDIPPQEEANGVVLSHATQIYLNSIRPKIELSEVLVDRNKWTTISIISGIISLVSLFGWYQANERFANHVKVAFVKLDPTGEHSISLYDENSKPGFYMNTVYSLLAQYVERRYSQVQPTIKSDYGFVLNFMSPNVQTDFLKNYHAAKIATEFETCRTCLVTKVKVRTIQHDETNNVISAGKKGAVYRSTIFARATQFNPEGYEVGSANQIITLVWRMKDISSLDNNIDAIQANPVGIEILSESLKVDPTPVIENK